MFEQLLDFICEKKIYTEVSGNTLGGTETILVKDGAVYTQKNVVFIPDMVKFIKFHEFGCTITLKH